MEDNEDDELPAEYEEPENEEEAEVEEEAATEADGEQDVDLGQLAEVLTVTGGITLGGKFSGNRKPPAELKKTTHCSACGELGHSAGDDICTASAQGKGPGKGKDKRSKDKPEAAKKVMSVFHHSGHQAPVQLEGEEDFGSMFAVRVTFHVNEVMGDMLGSLMVLDTACQRTCAGKAWSQRHDHSLGELSLKTYHHPCVDVFQFGKGKAVQASTRKYFPVAIGSTCCIFGAALLDAEIPFLASNTLLMSLGAILDLPNHLQKARGYGSDPHASGTFVCQHHEFSRGPQRAGPVGAPCRDHQLERSPT